MVIRIVKMEFMPEKVNEFLSVFNASKEKIAGFQGCLHLELLNEINSSTIFFTYSHWESEEHLNNYRKSELFNITWNKTKILFSEKPEAWTVFRKN